MNAEHDRLCSSREWADYLRDTLLPWALRGRRLGNDVIEVGPGPGLTTDLLGKPGRRTTAVEIDPALASALSARLARSNVRVVNADASHLPFPDACFSGAASFTMLHHVPSVAIQDRVLAELARVLRPGAWLVGVDSLDSPDFRKLHEGDVCVPIDPLTFADRLRRAGFVDVQLTVWSIGTRFVARTPPARRLTPHRTHSSPGAGE